MGLHQRRNRWCFEWTLSKSAQAGHPGIVSIFLETFHRGLRLVCIYRTEGSKWDPRVPVLDRSNISQAVSDSMLDDLGLTTDGMLRTNLKSNTVLTDYRWAELCGVSSPITVFTAGANRLTPRQARNQSFHHREPMKEALLCEYP